MPTDRGKYNTTAPALATYASWQPGDTYEATVGNNVLTYTYSGDVNNPFGQPTVAPAQQTAEQAAVTAKDQSQATKSDIVSYPWGKFMIVRDSSGNTIQDPDNPGVPAMVPLQSGDAADAYLKGLVAKAALSQAEADKYTKEIPAEVNLYGAQANNQNAQAGLAGAQAGQAGASTSKTLVDLQQEKAGQLGTFISQVASIPGMATDEKMQLIDAAVGKAINDYNDSAAKATAVDAYNQSQVQQSTQMANIATGFLNSALSATNQLAAAGGGSSGIGSMIANLPGFLKMMGGTPATLSNPLDQWAANPKLDPSLLTANQAPANGASAPAGGGSPAGGSAGSGAGNNNGSTTTPNIYSSPYAGLNNQPGNTTGLGPGNPAIDGVGNFGSTLGTPSIGQGNGNYGPGSAAGDAARNAIHPGQTTPDDINNINRYMAAGYSQAQAIQMAHGDALQRDFGGNYYSGGMHGDTGSSAPTAAGIDQSSGQGNFIGNLLGTAGNAIQSAMGGNSAPASSGPMDTPAPDGSQPYWYSGTTPPSYNMGDLIKQVLQQGP